MPGAIRFSRQSTSSSTSPPPACRSSTRAGCSRSLAATTTIEDTAHIFQAIVQNRKTYKTARGGETVWPPELESALLEGLASYQPDDSRETRLLGRFPMRNRIISDYIFDKTGKRRTPKQVGSRLQQLRDTCGEEQLLKLLSPVPRKSSSEGEADVTSTPALSPGDERAVIVIDILPDGVPCPCALRSCRFSSAIDSVQLPPSDEVGNSRTLPVHGRPLDAIDPTITFTASSEVDATSFFTVYRDMEVVYTQTIPLTASSSPNMSEDRVLFSTPLVPGYWDVICSSSDPTAYTIEHRVEAMFTSSCLFSAMFTFAYPRGVASGTSLNQLSLPSAASRSSSPRHHHHQSGSGSPGFFEDHHDSNSNSPSSSSHHSLSRSQSHTDMMFSSHRTTDLTSHMPFPKEEDFDADYDDMVIFHDDGMYSSGSTRSSSASSVNSSFAEAQDFPAGRSLYFSRGDDGTKDSSAYFTNVDCSGIAPLVLPTYA